MDTASTSQHGFYVAMTSVVLVTIAVWLAVLDGFMGQL